VDASDDLVVAAAEAEEILALVEAALVLSRTDPELLQEEGDTEEITREGEILGVPILEETLEASSQEVREAKAPLLQRATSLADSDRNSGRKTP
jgi:hypothetical protein